MHEIWRQIQSFEPPKLTQVFDEYEIQKFLVTNLSSVASNIVEIEPSHIKLLTVLAKCKEIPKDRMKSTLQVVRANIQTVHHSMELMKGIGSILDYLFIDSYEHEVVFA